jgi:hypothetical protein
MFKYIAAATKLNFINSFPFRVAVSHTCYDDRDSHGSLDHPASHDNDPQLQLSWFRVSLTLAVNINAALSSLTRAPVVDEKARLLQIYEYLHLLFCRTGTRCNTQGRSPSHSCTTRRSAHSSNIISVFMLLVA